MDANNLIERVASAIAWRHPSIDTLDAKNAALATIDALIADIDEQSIGNMRAHLISRRAQVAEVDITP